MSVGDPAAKRQLPFGPSEDHGRHRRMSNIVSQRAEVSVTMTIYMYVSAVKITLTHGVTPSFTYADDVLMVSDIGLCRKLLIPNLTYHRTCPWIIIINGV